MARLSQCRCQVVDDVVSIFCSSVERVDVDSIVSLSLCVSFMLDISFNVKFHKVVNKLC